VFEIQSKYKNEQKIVTDKDMQVQNIGSNVVDTNWDPNVVSKNSSLKISQKTLIETSIQTAYVIDFLKDSPPEEFLIVSDLMHIDDLNPSIPDYYDPNYILELIGILGENASYDFDEQRLYFTRGNILEYVTFNQIYDKLTNDFIAHLDEKITNIEEKVESLKVNIETSVTNIAENRVDISVFMEDSTVNISQINTLYLKIFDNLDKLKDKLINMNNKTQQLLSEAEIHDYTVDEKKGENVSQTNSSITDKSVNIVANSSSSTDNKYLIYSIIFAIAFTLIFLYFVYKLSNESMKRSKINKQTFIP
jgi:hypothetical protein